MKATDVACIPTSIRDASLMRASVTKHFPLIIALTALWLTVGILLFWSLKQTQGHLVYVLDDPYIHMALAKNLSEHGVWGVTRYEFSSSSSSLLWPLILSAFYMVFGANQVIPLIMNVVFASATLSLVYMILKKHNPPPLYLSIALLGIIFFTPLPALIFTGLEHVLQVLLTILIVYLSARILSRKIDLALTLDDALLCLLVPIVTLTRYEGLFLVAPLALLFLLRRRWLYSLSLVSLAIAPLAIYGTISAAHGWFWLPNSVLLKGNLPDSTSVKGIINFLGHSSYRLFLANLPMLLPIIGTLIVHTARFDERGAIWDEGRVMIAILVIATILHLQFASIGWFYRYEAYLVALGLFIFIHTLFEYLQRRVRETSVEKSLILKYLAVTVLSLLIILSFGVRGLFALKKIPRASTNIYEQQYQMGLFLKEFYEGAAIAANDIGAINYLADVKCLDLWGLGSVEVARKRLGGHYDSKQIDDLSRSKGVRLAIVYDHWFQADIGGLPSRWIKVGEWRITNNVVAGGEVVSFYAVDPSEEIRLIANLREFSSRLPVSVKQNGRYVEDQGEGRVHLQND